MSSVVYELCKALGSCGAFLQKLNCNTIAGLGHTCCWANASVAVNMDDNSGPSIAMGVSTKHPWSMQWNKKGPCILENDQTYEFFGMQNNAEERSLGAQAHEN